MTGLTVSRRGLFALAGAAALVVTSCSSNSDGSSSGEVVFSFTDARGEKVELDHLPETIVAQSSVAAALWDNGIKVKGIYGELNPVDYQTGDVDISTMTQLGSTFGEFNVEQFTALNPDLVVDLTFDKEHLWYAEEVEGKITKVAPGIGMALVGLTAKEQIEAFTELSEKLGADLDAAGVPQAKADFEAAGARVAAAAQAKPGLVISAVAPSGGELYIGDASQHPDLAHLAELGVTFPKVNEGLEPGPFETLSLENANKYPADVIILDARSMGEFEAIKDNPAWLNLPAVKAGQVYTWYPLAPFSYQKYAKIYNDLAAQIEGAQDVTP